jgi:hypothetical protein
MFGYRDLAGLIDLAGSYPMTNGWQVVIRAEWVDVSVGRPHGLSYALILQDEHGYRLFGFDNSHAFDGAREGEPFDHEHRANSVSRTRAYNFTSAGQLVSDFFECCKEYCSRQGVEFAFLEDAL